MAADRTVVFVDLTGSTGVFETLGNMKATQAVTKLTQWITQVVQGHDGTVVKTLGDGVLATFRSPGDAVEAMVRIQRAHQSRILTWPIKLRMRVKVGMARGELVEVNGDCYGDAVNVASRLSDLSGPDQIWATDSVINDAPEPPGAHFRSLGPINVRGKSEASEVYQVEWEEALTGALTQPSGQPDKPRSPLPRHGISLSWQDRNAEFRSTDMPVRLGRLNEVEFVINDPRVSRLHARIEYRDSTFVLIDASSFGTWVRFNGSDTDQALRRNECVLNGRGAIALGAPFDDDGVPTISFKLL